MAQRAPDHHTVRVACGHMVTLSSTDHPWPDLLLITLAQGLGGWMPQAQRDHNTADLLPDPGNVLNIECAHASWL